MWRIFATASRGDSANVNPYNVLTGKDRADFLKLVQKSQQRHAEGVANAATFWPHG
jgi:hypothetical protein